MAESLESIAPQKAVGYESETMSKSAPVFSFENWWEEFIGKLPLGYLSGVLVIIGGILVYYCGGHPFWHSFGEAIVVSGILVWFVDPFLKARLLKQASRGIFHYLLGFDQQPEIKERLRSLVFDTKLFRRNFYMKCTLIPDGEKMRLEMDCHFDVINPTNEPQEYEHLLQFERAEESTLRSMTMVSQQGSYTVNPVARAKSDDPVVVEYSAKVVKIQPDSTGRTYRFGSSFSMEYPLEFFYSLHLGTPTIGVTVEVVPPEGFQVSISPSETMTTNICTHDKLFMPGEHIDIRWAKTK